MKVSVVAEGVRLDVRCNNAFYQWRLVSGKGMSLCEPSSFFPDQCKYMYFLHFDHFIQLGRRLEALFDAQVSRI